MMLASVRPQQTEKVDATGPEYHSPNPEGGKTQQSSSLKKKKKGTAGYLVPCIESPGTLDRILATGKELYRQKA